MRGTEKGSFFYLLDGEKLRTTDLVESIFEALDEVLSNFVWGDEKRIINTDHLRRSTYEYSEYRVYFKLDSLSHARMTPKFARSLAKRLHIPSLRFCTDYRRIMEVCQKFNIRLFEDEISLFSNERLLEEFATPSGDRKSVV